MSKELLEFSVLVDEQFDVKFNWLNLLFINFKLKEIL